MEVLNLLRKISRAPGIPGFEDQIKSVIKEELSGYVDKIWGDAFGNLFVEKGSGEKKFMISAHMDEIGLMVKFIDDKGFIRFSKVGGVPDHILLGKTVLVHTPNGPVRGVIGCKAIHIMTDEERKQLVTYDKMFIDIGAGSREEALKMGVKIGSPITVEMEVKELQGGLVVGKAFDDRAGCAALVAALKEANPVNKVVAVFTVQEEVGLKGATVSAFAVNPDVGLAVDTTIAGDHPEVPQHAAPVKLGKGPTVLVADGRRGSLSGGLIAHPKVREWVIRKAEEAKIPYQLEVLEGGTTDATAMSLAQRGVPAGVISIPTRYVHSFSEVLHVKDLENTAKLLKVLMESELPL